MTQGKETKKIPQKIINSCIWFPFVIDACWIQKITCSMIDNNGFSVFFYIKLEKKVHYLILIKYYPI